MDRVLLATLLFQVWTPGLGFGQGAPRSTCESMTPEHGVNAQITPSPYTISVSDMTFHTGSPITVVIRGADYMGVLLQARSSNGTQAVGTWGTAPSHTKHLECSQIKQGAITHSDANTKNNNTVFTWNPPATSNSIYFIATIAKTKNEYWLNVTSEKLTGGSADLKMATTPALLLLTLLTSTVFQS
ncbi:putative defense protein Hdd11 [Brachyhypopomus gauderio]|uniref:putative defense protein Hdd11 n=1 Tax=Brachyhypopomus gauderio TaxID=698409 RepID=UPI004041DD21